MAIFKGKEWIHKAKTLPSKIRSRKTSDANREIEPKRLQSIRKLSKNYRKHIITGTLALGLLASLSYGGNHYVKVNMHELYHVYMNHQEVGTVSSPKVVEAYIQERYKKLGEQYTNVHMTLNTDELSYKTTEEFNKQADDPALLKKLDTLIQPQAFGVALKIDGKTIAYVKDQQTAELILDEVKSHYLKPVSKSTGDVSILSAKTSTNEIIGTPQIQDIGFNQLVNEEKVPINPSQITTADDVVKKIETGDVQPTVYTVQKGDCVSCIAHKFDITQEVVYANNPSLKKSDLLHIGDKLDLTVLQPLLAVKTVEKMQVKKAINYATNYENDSHILKGLTQVVTHGKEGEKIVTELVTKVNGIITDTKPLEEKITSEPVTALVKKGTKIISGLGTGHFRWPIVSPRITSGYGWRQGIYKKGREFHKGFDMVSYNRHIMAADNGKVKYVGWENGYGYIIILDHLNGYTSRYAHLKKYYVHQGQVVEKGQVIGYMGETGNATGVHIHFEIRHWGTPINPYSVLGK